MSERRTVGLASRAGQPYNWASSGAAKRRPGRGRPRPRAHFATSAMRGFGEECAHLGDVAGDGADVVLENGHRDVRLTSIHFQFESIWPVTKRADQAKDGRRAGEISQCGTDSPYQSGSMRCDARRGRRCNRRVGSLPSPGPTPAHVEYLMATDRAG